MKQVKVSDIQLWQANYRQGDVQRIKTAIATFGYNRSISLWKNCTVVAGNHVTKALQELEASQADVPPNVTVDDDGDWTIEAIDCSHLDTYAEAQAWAIADNRTADVAVNDAEQLASLLTQIQEYDANLLKATGWDEDDVRELLNELEPPDPTDDPGAQIDRAEELNEQWQVQPGDLWVIGKHRLLCGDATCEADVERVMDGEVADMMFTDPPYGVNYTGGHFHSGDVNITRERPKLENDTIDIYSKFLPTVNKCVDGACYMFFADSKGYEVYSALNNNSFQVHALIIWHKTNATYAAMNAQYKQRHEPCLYFKPKHSTLRWCGASTENTLWEIKRDPINENHPTQKPVELPYKAIKNHKAETIYDPFGGSGTTMVACEQLGRQCRMIEIEPKYCAVILERMAGMGLEPVKQVEQSETL